MFYLFLSYLHNLYVFVYEYPKKLRDFCFKCLLFVTEHKKDTLIMQDILCVPTVTVEYCESEKRVTILRSSGICHIFFIHDIPQYVL